MSPIWFPWQRAIRTALAVIAGVIISTASVLGLVLVVAPQLLEAVRTLLRPEDYALAVAWIAALTAVSAALSRVMAIPQVDAFLHRFGAGSAPTGAVAVTEWDGSQVGLTRRQYRAMVDGADTGEKDDQTPDA